MYIFLESDLLLNENIEKYGSIRFKNYCIKLTDIAVVLTFIFVNILKTVFVFFAFSDF